MKDQVSPIAKQNLSDDLAAEILKLIAVEGYEANSRLPTISELATRYEVGLPTVREALKKLETLGAIIIKHGSGMYVGEHVESIFIPNPIAYHRLPSKQIMLDLITARIPVELETAALAARNVTDEELDTISKILADARENLENETVLQHINLSFHRAIAKASRNTVLHQIMGVLSTVFERELEAILRVVHSKQEDYEHHVAIYEALVAHDAEAVVIEMNKHLQTVRAAIEKWDSEELSANDNRTIAG